ncbi:MAG: ATP-binding protein [Cyanobacteria bacterium P01_C01_bin.89]
MKQLIHATLRVKLIASFLAVSLVPITLLTIWNRQQNSEILLERSQQNLLHNTQQTANTLTQFLTRNLAMLNTQARLPTLGRYLGESDAARRSQYGKEVEDIFLTLTKGDVFNISSYALIDADGVGVIDTRFEKTGNSYKNELFFTQAIKTGFPFISDVIYSEEASAPIIFFSSPVRDDADKVVGVLLIRYNASTIQDIVSRSHPSNLAILVDQDNLRLAQNDDSGLIMNPVSTLSDAQIQILQERGRLEPDFTEEDKQPIPGLKKELELETEGERFFEFNYKDELHQAVVVPLSRNPNNRKQQWSLVVAQPQSAFLAPIEAQLRDIIVFWLVCAVVVSLAAIALGYTLTKPIAKLMGAVRRLANGDLTARSPVRRHDELGKLSVSFNDMAERIGQLLNSLENRSQELEMSQSTTMAIGELAEAIFERDHLLQGAVQLLLERFRLEAAYVYLWDSEKERLIFAQAAVMSSQVPTMKDRVTSWIAEGARTQETQVFQGEFAAVAVPMVAGSQLLGVLEIQDHRRPRFTEAEQETFKTLTNQIAIAWNNAKLIEDIRVAREKSKRQAMSLERTLQKLQSTQSQLIQTEKMSGLGQLVAGIAHEINNPMNYIHGNLRYMEEYLESLIEIVGAYKKAHPNSDVINELMDEDEFEFLLEDSPNIIKSMKMGTDRIKGIVYSLRNFSRLDEAEFKTADIHEGIDSTLLILQHRLKAGPSRGAIKVTKNYEELPHVDCFPGQLNQVFMNILANAIDALDEAYEGAEGAAIDISSQAVPNKNRVKVIIEDNGPGIPESVKQRIFDPFFTTKPVGKGTGLGMSISYQIVIEKHRGELDCQSISGEGTRFEISIPIHQEKSQDKGDDDEEGDRSEVNAVVAKNESKAIVRTV